MGRDHRAERLIAEIAAQQFGVVSGRQAGWAGIPKRTFGRWVGRGRMFRIAWSSYSATPFVSDHGRILAALLDAGADRHLDHEPPPRGELGDAERATMLDGTVVISHWAALRLRRVVSTPLLPIDVTVVGRGNRPRTVGVRGHDFRALAREDVGVVDGIPTTTVPRSLIDVAPTASGERLRRAIREAQFLGTLGDAELVATAARTPRHPGVRALRASDPDLPLRLAGDSPLAGDVGVFLQHETALGPWVSQHPFTVRGRTYHLDFARPDLALAVEADGAGAHVQSQGRTADARRDAALLARTWATVRITRTRLQDDPGDLREELHAIATARGWHGPAPGWQPRSAARSCVRAA